MKTAFLGVVVGLAALVAVVGTFAAFFAVDRAQRANASAEEVATVHEHIAAAPAAAAHSDLASFAGNTAPNADAIAMKHVARDATLPPIPAGDVVPVNLVLKDVTIEIAPGVKYAAWGFEGGAPGPAIHVRQGQTVKITLKNGGAIPHSVDFHAARIAPNVAFKDVAPGKSLTYTFEATDPGVFMYHCGTKPVLAHIANGMFGAIIVEPATPLPPADKEYVLVSSEWYLNSDGIEKPASFSMDKAHAMMPDWTTWNGYAGQYVTHPLTSKPGETVRFGLVPDGLRYFDPESGRAIAP